MGLGQTALLASVGVWRIAKPIWHVCTEQEKNAFVSLHIHSFSIGG
jgi:hypothetical protein